MKSSSLLWGSGNTSESVGVVYRLDTSFFYDLRTYSLDLIYASLSLMLPRAYSSWSVGSCRCTDSISKCTSP